MFKRRTHRAEVRIGTYVRCHGAPPTGYGVWIFQDAITGGILGTQGNYRSAVRYLRRGQWILHPHSTPQPRPGRLRRLRTRAARAVRTVATLPPGWLIVGAVAALWAVSLVLCTPLGPLAWGALRGSLAWWGVLPD